LTAVDNMKPRPGHNLYGIVAALMAASVIICAPGAASEDYWRLQYLLEVAGKNPDDAIPKDRIYFNNDIVYCTGTSDLAKANNASAKKMETGDFAGAAELLNAALPNAALFFPFRYNLGICYRHLDQLKKSLLNFKKAQTLVPEYSGTYLQIGAIYQLWYRDNEAIDSYKEALKWNRNELNTYVLIGDLFFNRNQIQLAKKYYDQCLRINHRFNNGILGRAKIHFREGEYYRALLVLKSINTREEYDKSYHFYYAECSYKLEDYATASQHYAKLLENTNDKFFLTYSVSLIKHKYDLSNRFIQK
jgi:tetratricopeptide (TPR) repeat protein